MCACVSAQGGRGRAQPGHAACPDLPSCPRCREKALSTMKCSKSTRESDNPNAAFWGAGGGGRVTGGLQYQRPGSTWPHCPASYHFRSWGNLSLDSSAAEPAAARRACPASAGTLGQGRREQHVPQSSCFRPRACRAHATEQKQNPPLTGNKRRGSRGICGSAWAKDVVRCLARWRLSWFWLQSQNAVD